MKRYIPIFEKKQVGTIYHFTSLQNLCKIIDDDFVLKSSSETGGVLNSIEPINYISFSRKYDFGARVRITIDGDKLSERYKIEPFQDIAAEVNRTNIPEAEERIVTNRINIKNYINSIEIHKDVVYGLTRDIKLHRQLTTPIELKSEFFQKYIERKYETWMLPELSKAIGICTANNIKVMLVPEFTPSKSVAYVS